MTAHEFSACTGRGQWRAECVKLEAFIAQAYDDTSAWIDANPFGTPDDGDCHIMKTLQNRGLHRSPTIAKHPQIALSCAGMSLMKKFGAARRASVASDTRSVADIRRAAAWPTIPWA